MSVATFDARVIAAFGRHLLVQDASGRTLRARPFGRDLGAVCGDEVRCRDDPHHGEVHVIEVLPRRTTLYRSNARGRVEPVLANLSLLLVVIAPLPPPDAFIADRYLAAARSADIAATLVLNKSELGIEVEIGGLMRDEEGRHTTTVSRLYELAGGGKLIDSPGVRDFAPAVAHLDPRNLGFVEVARLAPGCRFLDCRHLREPGCAVRQAVESGSMDARRYESYRRLRRLAENLTARW